MRELFLIFLLIGFAYAVGPVIHKLQQSQLDPHEELIRVER